VPHDEPERLKQDLRDEHRIEIPVHAVDGRTLVRLSVQGYVTEEDCERLVDALGACTRGRARPERYVGTKNAKSR
jgi:selenocysteine lyase/cysteine desulfurase